ncbi:hypothetical protein P9112_002385 [Eukaryota sp. TZLM1-RC]
MLLYNHHYGFLDAVCRGYISTLINSKQYSSLSELTSISDLRVHLSHQEYSLLKKESSSLSSSRFHSILRQHFVEQFNFIKHNASGLLAEFLEYLTIPYQINNLMTIIHAAIHNQNVDDILIEKCHPLGIFHNLSCASAASSAEELYRLLLCDTKLGQYFQQCLSVDSLTDVHIELISNSMFKSYLEDFYKFAKTKLKSVGGHEISKLIEFESDQRIINIVVHSFKTDLSHDERSQLFPKCTSLHPSIVKELSRATSMGDVESCLASTVYGSLLTNRSSNLTLEDLFYRYEMSLIKKASLLSSDFSVFYCYVRMKEQEVRNLLWVFQCILHQEFAEINRLVTIF